MLILFNYLNVLILRKISSTTFSFIIAKVKCYCVDDGWRKKNKGWVMAAWLPRDTVYIKSLLCFSNKLVANAAMFSIRF